MECTEHNLVTSQRSMAVLPGAPLSGKAAPPQKKTLLPPQSPRGFSALARLYYLAHPTKTAMLPRLFDHPRSDVLSFVIWSRVFWLSLTWSLRKAHWHSDGAKAFWPSVVVVRTPLPLVITIASKHNNNCLDNIELVCKTWGVGISSGSNHRGGSRIFLRIYIV